MKKFVVSRNILIPCGGVWFFEFFLDYKLPEENNLLLFFVAIPVVWVTISQMWTSFSYREIDTPSLLFCTHVLSILMLLGTVFLVSAVLNSISDNLDLIGIISFHLVGWTVIAAMVMYDVVDSRR